MSQPQRPGDGALGSSVWWSASRRPERELLEDEPIGDPDGTPIAELFKEPTPTPTRYDNVIVWIVLGGLGIIDLIIAISVPMHRWF